MKQKIDFLSKCFNKTEDDSHPQENTIKLKTTSINNPEWVDLA